MWIGKGGTTTPAVPAEDPFYLLLFIATPTPLVADETYSLCLLAEMGLFLMADSIWGSLWVPSRESATPAPGLSRWCLNKLGAIDFALRIGSAVLPVCERLDLIPAPLAPLS